MSDFRRLTNEEKAVVSKVVRRFAKDKEMELPYYDNWTACFAISDDDKFTTCLLRDPGLPHFLYVGNSKRATYARMADRINPVVGEALALVRACNNALVGKAIAL